MICFVIECLARMDECHQGLENLGGMACWYPGKVKDLELSGQVQICICNLEIWLFNSNMDS